MTVVKAGREEFQALSTSQMGLYEDTFPLGLRAGIYKLHPFGLEIEAPHLDQDIHDPFGRVNQRKTARHSQ